MTLLNKDRLANLRPSNGQLMLCFIAVRSLKLSLLVGMITIFSQSISLLSLICTKLYSKYLYQANQCTITKLFLCPFSLSYARISLSIWIILTAPVYTSRNSSGCQGNKMKRYKDTETDRFDIKYLFSYRETTGKEKRKDVIIITLLYMSNVTALNNVVH